MRAQASDNGFEHEAFLFAATPDFLGGTMPFVREGVEAGEPVLVVVDRAKIRLLRDALPGYAGAVEFADMDEVGANPARIIPPGARSLTGTPAPPRSAASASRSPRPSAPDELVEVPTATRRS